MFSATPQVKTVKAVDRRSHRRYPIDLALRWKVPERNLFGVGKIQNISASGISFLSAHPFQPGSLIALSVDWPCLLNGACPLQLKVEGRVIRNDQLGTAIRIVRYKFCTRKIDAVFAEGRRDDETRSD
jgi:PilZ domain